MTESYTVHLPWFDKNLMPNKPKHWTQKAKAIKVSRTQAAWQAWIAKLPKMGSATRILVSVTFIPPDKRRRDRDNCIAATKAYQDGIADYIEADDYKFHTEYEFKPPEKPGSVIFTLTPEI